MRRPELLRYRLRELILGAVVALSLMLFVAFAAMTRAPEHPWVNQAVALPGLGPVAATLRQPFLPDEDREESGTRIGAVGTGGRRGHLSDRSTRDGNGDRTGIQTAENGDSSDTEWIGLGARVYPEPNRVWDPLHTTTSLERYIVLARRTPWLEILLDDGRTGWVDRSQERDLSRPPLGQEPLPPGPLPASAANALELDAALALLGSDRRSLVIDRYPTWTDLPIDARSELFTRLATALDGLETTYSLLYGRVPVGAARETLVLYSEQDSYRELQRGGAELEGQGESAGHTLRGLVALSVTGREPWDVESTLVHEIGHLLNRRALGPNLPPWLSEGLADHLAQLGRTERPEFDPELRVLETSGELERVTTRGSLAALRLLADDVVAKRLDTLEELTALSEEEMVEAARAPLRYAHAAFFIDFLLQEEDLQPRFRAFLTGVARGEAVSPKVLLEHLESTWSELEARFREWLIVRAARAELLFLTPS